MFYYRALVPTPQAVKICFRVLSDKHSRVDIDHLLVCACCQQQDASLRNRWVQEGAKQFCIKILVQQTVFLIGSVRKGTERWHRGGQTCIHCQMPAMKISIAVPLRSSNSHSRFSKQRNVILYKDIHMKSVMEGDP